MKKIIVAIGNFVKEIFTDAKGRPEIKMILGVPLVVVATIYGVNTKDWAGFGAISGLAMTLIGAVALADNAIDTQGK